MLPWKVLLLTVSVPLEPMQMAPPCTSVDAPIHDAVMTQVDMDQTWHDINNAESVE